MKSKSNTPQNYQHVEYTPPPNAPIVDANRSEGQSEPEVQQPNPEAHEELDYSLVPSQNADAKHPTVLPDSLPWVSKPEKAYDEEDKFWRFVWLYVHEFQSALRASSDDKDHWRHKVRDARKLNHEQHAEFKNWWKQFYTEPKIQRENTAKAERDHNREAIRQETARQQAALSRAESYEVVMAQYRSRFEPSYGQGELLNIANLAQIGKQIAVERAKSKPDVLRWDELFVLKGQCSHGYHRQQWKDSMAQYEADRAAGLDVSAPEWKTWEGQIADTKKIEGQQIREELRKVSVPLNESLARCATLFAEGAKRLSKEMLIHEKVEAARWGRPYEPSSTLQLLVHIALTIEQQQPMNNACGVLISPRDCLGGVIDPHNQAWNL
jgi:hypothetical protein